MSKTIDEVRSLLEVRIAEIDAEHSQLTMGLRSLGGETAVASRPKRPRGRSRKRAPRGQRRQQLLDVVKENSGITVADAAREIGITPNQTHGLARTLRDDGLLRKGGEGLRLK